MNRSKPDLAPRTWRFPPVLGLPNNASLPLLVHAGAVAGDGADAIESLFDANGWPPAWRYGVFAWHHFHTTAHEALGAFRGSGSVQFGGADGPVIEVTAGDVVVIPAGVGHCLVRDAGLTFVGAYPRGQRPDQWRAGEGDEMEHAERVRATPLPVGDPVFGASGPLMRYWTLDGASGPRRARLSESMRESRLQRTTADRGGCKGE